jgi:hypothetical protein
MAIAYMNIAMTDAYDHRCPNCGSTDLVSFQLTAIDDQLLECQSCKGLCQVKYAPDRSTRLWCLDNDTILTNGSIAYRGGQYETRASDLVLRPD